MMLLKVLLFLFLIVLFLLFIAQNAGYVDVSLFHIKYSVPLFVLLLLSFTLGFILPSIYFLLREAGISRQLGRLRRGLAEFSAGYLSRAERELRATDVGDTLLAFIYHTQGRLEELRNIKGPSLALSGYILMKEGRREEAKELLEKALSEDPDNLNALKGLRDYYALKGDWNKSLEYQERVLDLCERWEREEEKRIKAEIFGKLYEERGEDKWIEKALDLQKTPYLYALYLKHLLSSDKEKDARKHWEKIVSSGYQEEVLWCLMEEEQVLMKMLNFVEQRAEAIEPDTLASFYMRLNLFSKAKELEDKISPPVKAMLYAYMSHKEQDKLCLNSLRELYKPFACSCEKDYNRYEPICESCLKWGEIKLRRV